MTVKSLLYEREYAINEQVRVRIPTVGEIMDDEDNYYGMVSMLTAMPIDMMAQLDGAGIDFTQIDEYNLFLLLFRSLREKDASLILGDLDLRSFAPAVNPQNDAVVLRDSGTGAVIDRLIHARIAATLRRIHHLKKNIRRPANQTAKDYMLERARIEMRRNANKEIPSQLEELIVALVNTEQFGYGFEDVRNLTIYQFNESVRQVVKKVDYDNRMRGVYAGTVSVKDLSQDDLNWLTHK